MNVIVHGGAGGTPEEPEPRQVVLDDAAGAGSREPTPLDAVETTVRTLESSPRFNAGTGSAVQSDGGIRTDAGVMTDDRRAGAVCSLPGVEHAISAARVVLEETPHVLISGIHAVELASEFGIETACDLWSERTRDRWASASSPDGTRREQLSRVRERFGDRAPTDHSDHDTVGAVACDGSEIAAATSTGGRWMALAGRVGDVPQIGSGFYCTPAGGASATGAGEDIARLTLCRQAVDELESGYDPQTAADRVIETFADTVDSSAGIIVLDADGTAGVAYNSECMQTSFSRSADEKRE